MRNFLVVSILAVLFSGLAMAQDVNFSGDIRLRQENKDTNNTKTSRQRLRLRVGATADISDDLEARFRLATGGTAPRSTNVTLNGSTSKEIHVDRANVVWQTRNTNVIVGKVGVPFVNVEDTGLLWDSDLSPEGATATWYGKNFNLTGGSFLIDGSVNTDARLSGIQVDSTIRDIDVTLGYLHNSNTINFNQIKKTISLKLTKNIKIFTNYITNTNTTTQKDAWLVGTKIN